MAKIVKGESRIKQIFVFYTEPPPIFVQRTKIVKLIIISVINRTRKTRITAQNNYLCARVLRKMNVVIVKYNAGNVCSITNALQRLGIEPVITDNAEQLAKADKVIFPGVGEASSAMQYLKAHRLDEVIRNLQQPLLGICLGMQLLCRFSEEGNTPCLSIFDQDVKKFTSELKIPQIGWNAIENLSSKIFDNIADGDYVYFVHSYYAELSANTVATTDYGLKYSSALQKNNFYATQFHPEKSGKVGAKIIENFINL